MSCLVHTPICEYNKLRCSRLYEIFTPAMDTHIYKYIDSGIFIDNILQWIYDSYTKSYWSKGILCALIDCSLVLCETRTKELNWTHARGTHTNLTWAQISSGYCMFLIWSMYYEYQPPYFESLLEDKAAQLWYYHLRQLTLIMKGFLSHVYQMEQN